jgi:hypothetical protein
MRTASLLPERKTRVSTGAPGRNAARDAAAPSGDASPRLRGLGRAWSDRFASVPPEEVSDTRRVDEEILPSYRVDVYTVYTCLKAQKSGFVLDLG